MDDLRLVATAPQDMAGDSVEQTVFDYIVSLLRETAVGLTHSRKKTLAANVGGEVGRCCARAGK